MATIMQCGRVSVLVTRKITSIHMNSNNLVDWHRICVKYMYSALEVSRYVESARALTLSVPGEQPYWRSVHKNITTAIIYPFRRGWGATYPQNELDTAQLAMVRVTSLPRFTRRVTHQRPGRPMHNVFVVLLVSQLAYRVVSFREKEIYIGLRVSLWQMLHNTL